MTINKTKLTKSCSIIRVPVSVQVTKQTFRKSTQPKPSTQTLKQVPEIQEKLKMVSSLSYSFHQNLIIDLLTELNTLQVRNVIFYVSTGLNIPKIHIYLNLFLMFYNQTPEILLPQGKGSHSLTAKFRWKFKKLFSKKSLLVVFLKQVDFFQAFSQGTKRRQ